MICILLVSIYTFNFNLMYAYLLYGSCTITII